MMDLRTITVTKISNAFTYHSKKGIQNQMNNRPSYGLSLCIDGRITYIQNGVEFVSDKSCAVILPKGGSYRIRREQDGSFPLINFDCLESLCDTVTVIPISNAEALLADYDILRRQFCHGGSRAQIFGLFYGILHKLGSDSIPRELMGALRLIEGSYRDPALSNERLAKECNMSEVYFRKLFTKHFNISPKQYIIGLRIQRAKQLLTEGKLSSTEISESCGFSNPYHFSRLFKRHTGTTPLEYRRANLLLEM